MTVLWSRSDDPAREHYNELSSDLSLVCSVISRLPRLEHFYLFGDDKAAGGEELLDLSPLFSVIANIGSCKSLTIEVNPSILLISPDVALEAGRGIQTLRFLNWAPVGEAGQKLIEGAAPTLEELWLWQGSTEIPLKIPLPRIHEIQSPQINLKHKLLALYGQQLTRVGCSGSGLGKEVIPFGPQLQAFSLHHYLNPEEVTQFFSKLFPLVLSQLQEL